MENGVLGELSIDGNRPVRDIRVSTAMVLYFFVGPIFRGSLLGLFTAGYAASLALVSLLVPQSSPGRFTVRMLPVSVTSGPSGVVSLP